MLSSLLEIYSFQFMQYALAVGMLGGGLLAFLGIFVHLRRIVFLGAAMPQVIGLGIALAVFFALPPLGGAVFGGAAGILILSMLSGQRRISNEGWIGLAYAAGGSFSVVLIALSPAPDATVLRFFTGDVLGTGLYDLYYTLAVTISVGLIFFWFWSRFVMCGFDPSMAMALGIKVKFWDALLFFCLAISLSVIMNTAGGMLAFSMLIGPPAAALLLFRDFKKIIITAILTGSLAAFVGLTLSFTHDLPGGPAMASSALLTVPLLYLVQKLIAAFTSLIKKFTD